MLYTEEELSRHSLFHCGTPEELEESYTYHANARDTQREFYYSRSNCNRKRRPELTKRRYWDKTFTIERKLSGLSHPVSATADKITISKGTFICLNSNFPKAFKTMCRDKVSALAIGLAGLAYLLFGSTFP
ncbi:hypothetical protein EDC94DRAFT_660264 [Helicostylum pulchrum]|nr:hypothetical protein EDC94DRAFT_660264 [Helicostylum pulchrum]